MQNLADKKSLYETYHEITQLVTFVEDIVDGDTKDRGPNGWEILMITQSALPFIVKGIQHAINRFLESPSLPGEPPTFRKDLNLALEQTNHPQFLTYISGKLGAV